MGLLVERVKVQWYEMNARSYVLEPQSIDELVPRNLEVLCLDQNGMKGSHTIVAFPFHRQLKLPEVTKSLSQASCISVLVLLKSSSFLS
jgi:hypothetical protein